MKYLCNIFIVFVRYLCSISTIFALYLYSIIDWWSPAIAIDRSLLNGHAILHVQVFYLFATMHKNVPEIEICRNMYTEIYEGRVLKEIGKSGLL